MFERMFLVLLLIYLPNSSGVIDSLYNTGQKIWTLYSMLAEITLDDNEMIENLDELFSGDNVRSRGIKNQLDEIQAELDVMERSMYPKQFGDSLKLSPSQVMIRTCLDVIEISVQSIDECYEEFRKYINDSNCYPHGALHDLTRNIILKVEGEIAWIRKIVIEASEFLPSYKNIVDAISGQAINRSELMCDGQQIISNILVHLFRMVMIAEMKANVVLVFANIFRYSQSKGWKLMNSFAQQRFERQFATKVNVFMRNLNITDSLYLRACDSVNATWIRNHNFYELERTFHTTIYRYHWGICKYGTCDDVLYVQPNRCELEIYDRRTACSGTTGGCTYLSAIKACALKEGPRKFQYVNSTELGSLGSNFECPADNGYLIEDGTGGNFVYAACACRCFSSRNKISLAIVKSAIEYNKVIIGLRFFRKKNILYIQPREGKLDANGYIRRYSERWIPIPDKLNKSQIHSIDRNNKVFFLDNLRLPPYFVLTGVKFNKVRRGTLDGFAIEIFGVPFDYESGKLYPQNQYGTSLGASNDTPGVGVSFEAESSLHVTIPHEPNAANLNYVSLEQSSLSLDFGQSTLPFFDAVPVVTHPPSVLGGIGIFHKGVLGYAGFISLRVFGINYKQYFFDFDVDRIAIHKVLFNSSNRA